MARHYLDHASTSPLRPAARDALLAALDVPWADPSRVHREALEARVALEEARAMVAAALGARTREVVFTSGATESIATAAWGAAQRGRQQVITAVEHSAVRLAAAQFGEVVMVPVDGTGQVDPDEVVAALTPATAIVHLQWANHEVGTIQPLGPVVAACRERGVLVHVDAAQAVGRVPVDFASVGADLLSVSGHKVGGPAGIGVLLIRRGLRLRPLLVGGDQERARRAGLESIAGAVALAAALSSVDIDGEAAHQAQLLTRLAAAVTDVEGVTRYGHPADHLPHLLCVGIADIEPQAVLFGLDRAGIAAHSGSACASADLEPSPVLAAMGVDAHRSLRLSLGWSSTAADVEAVAAVLPEVVADLRRLR